MHVKEARVVITNAESPIAVCLPGDIFCFCNSCGKCAGVSVLLTVVNGSIVCQRKCHVVYILRRVKAILIVDYGFQGPRVCFTRLSPTDRTIFFFFPSSCVVASLSRQMDSSDLSSCMYKHYTKGNKSAVT